MTLEKSTTESSEVDINPLVTVMRQLRDKDAGCPWDIEQNFASIAPYTIEEAYEVVDAIERRDMVALKDELGDLLLQVVFHSQMASEDNLFTLDDVIGGICVKMMRRHPHVFGDNKVENADEVVTNWEAIKAQERANGANIANDDSQMAGVAIALPALIRADKIQKRAARIGFDWPNISGAIAKLHEEIDELNNAHSFDHQLEEYGDLLFAAVNIGRHLKIDPETALKAATAKFERRFRHMEKQAGPKFATLSLDEKEKCWLVAKAAEK